MEIKRPAILFLSSLILGIIVAYASIPTLFKGMILAIAIFLYLKLFFEGKLSLKVIFVILLFFIVGYLRFNIEKNIYDTYTENVESLSKGTKYFTGKIESRGNSTNSQYFIVSNCISDGKKLGTCRCYFADDNEVDAKIGNLISVSGSIWTIDVPMNEGEFNQENYYRSIGISFTSYAKNIEIVNSNYSILKQKIFEIKSIIKEQINKVFEGKDAGLFSAMITGDKSSIDKIQKKLFSDNGIAHILAISGLHLSILGLVLFEFLRRKFTVNFSAGVVSAFIFLYGIFIDASASSLRAIIMLYVRFLSLSIGRTYDSKNTLYIICAIFLLMHPYLLFNAGFQFSYLAIFALNHEVKKVPAVIVLTLFLFPVTIYQYCTYPLYSILLNLVVIPLMAFVLGFGITSIGLSFIFLPLGKISAYVVHIIFYIYETLCHLIEHMPAHILWLGKPTLYEILFYVVALFLVIWAWNEMEGRKKQEKLKGVNKILRITVCSVLLLLSIGILSIRERYECRLTFLSVGQGDGIIVESKGKYISIDGGSSSNTSNGQYIIAPHLKSRAIDRIDYAFVSHSDSDHTNGLMHLIQSEEELTVKNLILPINAKNEESFDKLKYAATSNNVNITYMSDGDEFKINDDTNIKVLGPSLDMLENKKMDVNNKSLIFRLDYKNHSALFTGDVGKLGINRMLTSDYDKSLMGCEVLKVPHHGSKNSLVNEFFEKVSPRYSVISYGKNNSYGHPHKVVVDKLDNIGTKTFKTAESGQIDMYFDKESISTKTFK